MKLLDTDVRGHGVTVTPWPVAVKPLRHGWSKVSGSAVGRSEAVEMDGPVGVPGRGHARAVR
jgi:hypothetical protein